ncbi:amino acid ABC transporter substrate-binding protein, PAAT family [Cyanobacterium stanieri PCC 7202]|uniref:Amino acid ABC transporter substrate-binding protein, PAAT family n=1 Tax=Cyanobacterium stanieri (strain ATCC 29140 / PCC 7202) TaxID=292563 RepID=K9YNZ2_CYASC|nr:amino acid ABC transporter substrate-binding protein, PAAT family [Cyanobacterium stanieri PCC 7202]
MFRTTLTKLFTISLLSGINLFSHSLARAETVLERIESRGLLRVGISANEIPFSYRDNNQELRGICLDLINLIKKEIKNTLNRQIITIHFYNSNLNNRFQLVGDGIVDLECGANSIREIEEYEVSFSEPFFVTGIQFLVVRDKANQLINDTAIEDVRIGVLSNTTTEEYVRQRFPQAQINLFTGINGSALGVRAVENDRIDAFADDGILLLGAATSLNMSLNRDFILLPQTPVTCEKYGLILPKNDPDWKELVDRVIISNEEREIVGDWFAVANRFINNRGDCTIN